MSGQGKKNSVGGQQYFFLFFVVDLAVFFVLIQSFDFSSFFLLIQSFDFSSFFLLIQSSNERSVLYLCFFCQIQLLCGHKFNSDRGTKKKQCKCQKLVKTFRIKKVPIKRNVFNDVIGWLSSFCNNVLYLTTQVVKRERHLYWVLLNDCFWQHF